MKFSYVGCSVKKSSSDWCIDSALFFDVIIWDKELTAIFVVKNDSLDSSSSAKFGLPYLNLPDSSELITVSNVPNPLTTSVKVQK